MVQNALDELRDNMPELAMKIEDLPWVKDGIARRAEFDAVRGLIRLAHAGYAQKLLEEPWVVDGRNYPALESLWYLVVNNPDTLTNIMSHPTISDGITDQEANIVAILHSAFEYSDLLDKLLDPEQVTVEERTITLPLAGQMGLSIIRTRPEVNDAMDLLELAIRSIEEFMGFPFPNRHVIYLFHAEPKKSDGLIFGNHVSLGPNQANVGDWFLNLLTHEAGHYYWGGGLPRWIEEGGAVLMESMVTNMLQGPLEISPCSARNIAELEELYSSRLHHRHICHYSLGERLFRDLYRNVDDTTFRLAFRRLYLHTLFNIPGDECDDYRKTICHVKEAFTYYVPEEKKATIEKVIARWHDGTELFDLSYLDDTPVEPDIAAIDGRIEEAYLSYSFDGPPVSVITAEPNRSPALYIQLEFSYRHSSGFESLPIEVVLSFEDGFEIFRTQTDMQLPARDTRRTHFVGIPSPGSLGRYWVHVYSGEQKIAEVVFEAVAAPDAYNIRGVVVWSDGQPRQRVALHAIRGEEGFWVEAGPDGTFDVVVSSGSFVLEVFLLSGTEWHSVGWYDGAGGITTDPSQAFEVIVDDADVEGIKFMLR